MKHFSLMLIMLLVCGCAGERWVKPQAIPQPGTLKTVPVKDSVSERTKESKRCSPTRRSGPPRRASKGVALTVQQTNQGLMVMFNINAWNLRALEYQLDGGNWVATGPSNTINPDTGEQEPARYFVPEPDFNYYSRHALVVRWTDASGVRHGPVKLELDVVEEIIRHYKVMAEGSMSGNWVAFREWGEELLLYFPILSSKQALCEIRYSFDSPELDSSLPFIPSDDLSRASGTHYNDPDPIKIPVSTQLVFVQLIYLDGTKSAVRKFDRRYASIG